jgi:hypothetical protein
VCQRDGGVAGMVLADSAIEIRGAGGEGTHWNSC